jgi:acyl-CoA dehydrogenase
MSSCFALMTDACVSTLGGSLKRREKVSGRLADVLSNMYVITAVLKHFEDEGQPEEDIPLLQWACDDALFNIQTAMKGVMLNLPVPVVGRILNIIIFPLSKPYQKPDDKLGHKVARLLLEPSDTRERLSSGIYVNDDPEDATGRIEYALNYVLKTSELEKKIRVAKKEGRLSPSDNIYFEAKEKNIISENEYALLIEAEAAILNAIKVDEFSNTGWKIETP